MAKTLSQLRFSEPVWFILLLGIPLLVYFHVNYLRQRSSGMKVNGPEGLFSGSTGDFSPVDLFLLLRLLAVGSMVLALASPQLVVRTETWSQESGTDMVFALDVSKSMSIEDVKPSRIEALKNVLNRFISLRPTDRMGIVLYAGESMNWCPLTKDRPLLIKRVNEMSNSDLSDGTAIGSGLLSAVNILKQSDGKTKVIILLSDGENNAGSVDPLMAAGFAKRLNIKIYVIGIGSTGMAQMPLIGSDGKKYYQNIFVTLNEAALKSIALLTGGVYFKAADADALRSIYASIDKFETKKRKPLATVSYESCFNWFAAFALLLVLTEFLLKFTVFRIWPA